nr:methyltransferase domain-containing protein [Corynebacterium mendelii]
MADPQTGQPLALSADNTTLSSADGRGYVIAPEGFVVAKGPGAPLGDTGAMVHARETFLSGGQFGPFVEAVTEAVHDALDDAADPYLPHPVIVDLGAGTGYYLAHTLDDIAGAYGIGVDVSEPAATLLAASHPRVAAICADVTATLPVADHSVDVVTVVFAPHNPEECARILKKDGQLVVLTAVAGHLSQLRAPLGITDPDDDVLDKLNTLLGDRFSAVGPAEIVDYQMQLDQQAIATQISMSPSARHIDAATLAQRAATLPDRMNVTARAAISRFTPNS